MITGWVLYEKKIAKNEAMKRDIIIDVSVHLCSKPAVDGSALAQFKDARRFGTKLAFGN